MPIAKKTAASTAHTTVRPWPTKASSSFRATATTPDKNNIFVQAPRARGDLDMVSNMPGPGIEPHMNVRRLILLVGAVVLVIGVIGLLMPVSVPGPNNGSIGCGNALAQDSSTAQQADNQNPANLPIINQVVPHKIGRAHV